MTLFHHKSWESCQFPFWVGEGVTTDLAVSLPEPLFQHTMVSKAPKLCQGPLSPVRVEQVSPSQTTVSSQPNLVNSGCQARCFLTSFSLPCSLTATPSRALKLLPSYSVFILLDHSAQLTTDSDWFQNLLLAFQILLLILWLFFPSFSHGIFLISLPLNVVIPQGFMLGLVFSFF